MVNLQALVAFNYCFLVVHFRGKGRLVGGRRWKDQALKGKALERVGAEIN
jgi:hypothetical protein